jgi:hypothetical protein
MIALLLALWAAPPPGTLLSARQTPDTALTRELGAPLLALRDSLFAVQASGGAFQRDLAAASPDLVIARAQRVQESCVRAVVAVRAAQRALATTPLAPGPRARAAELQRLLPQVQADLSRCQREFDPGAWYARVDSLRAWGPFRLAQLDARLLRAIRATDHMRAVLGYKS